jgi:hypothetical protein
MKNLSIKKYFIIITFCSFLILSFFLTQRAEAQENIFLTASPARQEILVDPGEKTAVVIKFLNQSSNPVSGPLQVADFIVESKDGAPTFLNSDTTVPSRFTAASWVELPYDRITIAPKDKVVIQVKINVPVNAEPGGRYFALLFEPGGKVGGTTGLEKEAETPITSRLASLISLRVSGPVEENAYATQLQVPRFLEYGPISVITEIKNQGNYHIRPKGVISLTNLFGKKIDEEILVEQNIFPEVSRIFENRLGSKWMFGKYKIELNAAYGETGKILTATAFTWIIPWKLIILIIGAIIILILLISFLYHRFNRREVELEKKIEELEEKLAEKS